MIQAKQELLAALHMAIREVSPGAGIVAAFESPKLAAHGDLACTTALQLSKTLGRPPRDVAQALIGALKQQAAVQRLVAALEIAGPGFINLRLTPAARQAVVAEVLAQGAQFGRKPITDAKVLVEFVSANPTGPLHVGHARQAALGDAICNLFETQGWSVTREFYYNDAGVQIENLARSVLARLHGLSPGDPAWPANAAELERQACVLGNIVTTPQFMPLFGLAAKGDPILKREANLEPDEVDLPKIQSIWIC